MTAGGGGVLLQSGEEQLVGRWAAAGHAACTTSWNANVTPYTCCILYSLLNHQQDVLSTSAAYGAYMATSSNLRYQMLAGIVEERGIETIFKGNYQLCAVLSFIVRTGNTFLGSLLWVDFVRLLGMQKAGGDKDH